MLRWFWEGVRGLVGAASASRDGERRDFAEVSKQWRSIVTRQNDEICELRERLDAMEENLDGMEKRARDCEEDRRRDREQIDRLQERVRHLEQANTG